MSTEFNFIPMPTDEVFFNQYMAKLEPIVITNFFENELIRNINTRKDVIDHWGDTHIFIENEYMEEYNRSLAGEVELVDDKEKDPSLPIREYFRYTDSHPDSKMMCIEFPTPKEIGESYSIPSVCHSQGGESSHFVNQCFIGNGGNVANLHFDKGGTHGFLYQVFGEKRFIIIPYTSSQKLAPFSQFGAWRLKEFSEKDRKEFLQWCNGKEVVLRPGDCMYVPMFCWHFADYVTDSMSISLRFRRPDRVTRLLNCLYPDYYLQGIASKFADHAFAGDDILKHIEEEYAKPFPSGVERMKHMRMVARDVYKSMFPEFFNSYFVDLNVSMPDPLPHFLDSEHDLKPLYS